MLLNYVQEPNSNLLCCICRTPFNEPVTTRSCSHTFCRDCITQAISHARQCPVDRSVLTLDDLVPANSIIRSLVDELVVECIHRSSGCTFTCQRQLLAAHVMDTCPYRTTAGEEIEDVQSVPCSLCGAEFALEDLEEHTPECAASTVNCEFCTLELARSELGSHTGTCSAAIIPCVQVSNGCRWTGPRTDLKSQHTPSCPYEALSGFFELHNSKFARVAEENLFLRHRLEVLESRVQTQQRDLNSAKTALGPWFRSDGVYAHSSNNGGLASSADLPLDLQPGSASTSSRRYSQADTSPTFEQHPPDALAAYFPAEADSFERRPGWDAPFGAGSGTANSQNTVAPLNLSTTLEGSLTGVRASVVALGGAVDSLARRSDIALSNETRRLNEEVMSLRANMHGLRMQVHAIMMDRNAQVTGRSGEGGGGSNSVMPNPMSPLGPGDGAWPPPARFFYPGPGGKL
ncbi:hypothetical protein FB45DRAFT_892655 [Roridomyces roridus]|uniref:RING-type domain-containing protein n=1 Tax=Roridomyces roridus TaxID=1738132 RepID=A0AAD7CFC4_9AGAR|nr:hypothetical protein FB45DRAFT_892655 [Roridomyces roridus]